MDNQTKAEKYMILKKREIDYMTAIIDLSDREVVIADMLDNLVEIVERRCQLLHELGYSGEQELMEKMNEVQDDGEEKG